MVKKYKGGAVRGSMEITGLPDTNRMRAVFQRTLAGIAEQAVETQKPVVQQMLKAPASVARPIQWTSRKQQIAVIIKLKEENNLPYKRTGSLENANRLYVVKTPTGASIVLENRSKYAKYVYGGLTPETAKQQQRFHINSGWPSFQGARDAIMAATLQAIREDFSRYLIAFGAFEASGKRQVF